MTDTEKILEAVSQGPLPLHVLRRRTGLNHGLEMALRPLVNAGKLVKHGEMVALPVPSYTDPITPLEGGEMASGDDHTEEWPDPLEGPTVPMDLRANYSPPAGANGPAAPLDDPDQTREMEPVEFRGDHGQPPEEELVEQPYYVAIEWTEVSAVTAEEAAALVLDESAAGGTALVMLAEEGIVFERALVVRRKP